LRSGSFFEFGIGPADGISYDRLEGNFVALQKQGWTGVFLDGQPARGGCPIRQEFITALNINQLFVRHAIPPDLDLMSIDVDGQEFWIWMALRYRPKVMVVEINGGLGIEPSVTIGFDIHHRWDGTLYHGASLRAIDKLARCKDYSLVWSNGINAIAIRDDLISNLSDFVLEDLFRPYPPHLPDPKNRPWVEI
jgi:hypothetical protein